MSKQKPRMLFVRHGQSVANASGFIAGHLNYHLTDQGVRDAIDAARKIEAGEYDIFGIYTSDLIRAERTASIIRLAFRGAVFEKWSDLQEVNYGFEWNETLSKEYPSGIDACAKGREGAETLEQVYDRASRVLDKIRGFAKLAEGYEDPFVDHIFVGHNTFTSMIFAVNEGVQVGGLVDYRKNKWENLKNGELRELVLQ